jgi:hypothetical protein
MFTGTTKYPDEFSRAMSAGYTKILFKDANERQNGFKLAARAFELRPSQGPLLELLSLARHPELKGQVGELLKDYVSKFQQNLEQYKKEDGLNNKLIAALIAANYLEKTANDPRLVDQYHNAYVKYKDMQSDLMENSRW